MSEKTSGPWETKITIWYVDEKKEFQEQMMTGVTLRVLVACHLRATARNYPEKNFEKPLAFNFTTISCLVSIPTMRLSRNTKNYIQNTNLNLHGTFAVKRAAEELWLQRQPNQNGMSKQATLKFKEFQRNHLGSLGRAWQENWYALFTANYLCSQFDQIALWEKDQGNAKRSDIEEVFNVNRSTYHRWKKKLGIQ